MDAQHTRRVRAEQSAIDGLVERLVAQFPELPRKAIVDRVEGAVGGYAEARVRDFVPVLVERSVREDLGSRHRA